LAYKILILKLPKNFSVILSVLLPIFQAYVYGEGNTTEEYILPLLFASFYCMLKWCNGVEDNGVWEHKPRTAVLYGVTFAFALMTRVTNAVGVCIGVAFIAIMLMFHRKWKNLFSNICFFMLGIVIIVVPFIIYFGLNGALYEMWYGTILYNFDYAEKSVTLFSRSDIVPMFRMYFYGGCLMITALYKCICLKNKNSIETSIMWLLIAVGNVLYLCVINKYPHYSSCLTPLLFVALNMLIDDRLKSQKYKKITAVLLCCAIGADCPKTVSHMKPC
jgi:4-amino-4-deoxy-L-arabinose transferase-like glycosyltransferase